jgi:hypothetical protein
VYSTFTVNTVKCTVDYQCAGSIRNEKYIWIINIWPIHVVKINSTIIYCSIHDYDMSTKQDNSCTNVQLAYDQLSLKQGLNNQRRQQMAQYLAFINLAHCHMTTHDDSARIFSEGNSQSGRNRSFSL